MQNLERFRSKRSNEAGVYADPARRFGLRTALVAHTLRGVNLQQEPANQDMEYREPAWVIAMYVGTFSLIALVRRP